MIKFPKGYFETEVKNGFLIESEMKHAWAAQLEMLKICEQICNDHNLIIFAMYGTLLGAVRHEGYIPWDDDIDVGMMREDYQKMLDIIQNEYVGKLDILNCFTDSDWDELVSRIINGRSLSVSGNRMLLFHGCPYAMGLDVFPIDSIPKDKKTKEWVDSIIFLICKILPLTWLDFNNKNLSNEEESVLFEGLRVLEESFNFEFFLEGNLRNQVMCLFDAICSSYGNQNKDDYVTKYPGYVLYGEDYFYHKLWFSNTVKLRFESTTINAPIGYDAILYTNFGYDYMIPRQAKASHDYPHYKGQRELLKENGLYEYVQNMKILTTTASCADEEKLEKTPSRLNIPEEWISIIGNRNVKVYGLNSAAIFKQKGKIFDILEDELAKSVTNINSEVFILVADAVFYETIKAIVPGLMSRYENIQKKILENNGIVADSTLYKFYEICDEYLGDCTSAVYKFLEKEIPMKFEKYEC